MTYLMTYDSFKLQITVHQSLVKHLCSKVHMFKYDTDFLNYGITFSFLMCIFVYRVL